MSDSNPASGGWHANVRRQTVRLAYWTLAWLVTMAVATFGPQFIWTESSALTPVAILINLLTGFGMIWANKEHLRSLDELQQRIQLEAMGIALGVGLVVGMAYSNLDISNVISADAEISFLVIVVALTYLVSVVLGTRKYR
jgi:uncharacterized protein YacL